MRKHSTFNIQLPTPKSSGGERRSFIGCWKLNVECSVCRLLLAVLVCGVIQPLFAEEPAVPLPQSTAAATSTNTVLDEAAVTKLLTAALQAQFTGTGDELALRFTRPWVVQSAPAGQLTLKILEMPNNGVTSAFIVRFEILTADGRSIGNWQVPVQAHLWREVHVAHSMLKPGGLVAGADIGMERRDVLALREPLAEFADGDTKLEIAESIPAGSPLFARSVRLRPVVRRGQMTNARLEDGALSVTIKVQALEDGTPGQIIRLRNLQSTRDFSGKVLDEKNVLVSL
jgi:flagella basal body P-ring formation protein FlgA